MGQARAGGGKRQGGRRAQQVRQGGDSDAGTEGSGTQQGADRNLATTWGGDAKKNGQQPRKQSGRESKHNRAARQEVAQETLRIVQAGGYECGSTGQFVPLISSRTAAADPAAHTSVFIPTGADLTRARAALRGEEEGGQQGTGGSAVAAAWVAGGKGGGVKSGGGKRGMVIEVTREGTLEAAGRVVKDEAEGRVVCLNFASAKNPGGGFMRGSLAQEESLALCSTLYSSLVNHKDTFYANHRRDPQQGLYSDDMIYSAGVRVFRRDRDLQLLDAPFAIDVVTAAAPNRGVAMTKGVKDESIDDSLRRRAARVVDVALACGARAVVLGAWGCGVFKNDPCKVARAFKHALSAPKVTGRLDRVVFAILSRGHDANFKAFDECFS